MGEESRRGGGGEITESDRIFKCRDRYRLNQIIWADTLGFFETIWKKRIHFILSALIVEEFPAVFIIAIMGYYRKFWNSV